MNTVFYFVFLPSLTTLLLIVVASLVRKNKYIDKSFELSEKHKELLILYIPFYKNLSKAHRKRFDLRLVHFIRTKQFMGMHGFLVTPEIKVLISAIVIKMTFGFDAFLLPHFKKIEVYPDAYLSELTRQYHKGDVDLKGNIRLAWTHFSSGILNYTDGQNLAVHEIAHAIYFENEIKNKQHGFINPKALKEWNFYAEREMLKMRNTSDHFLRDYASVNLKEFFAVSSEHFFEQAKEFNQKHHKLYELLTLIYRLNPIDFNKSKTHS